MKLPLKKGEYYVKSFVILVVILIQSQRNSQSVRGIILRWLANHSESVSMIDEVIEAEKEKTTKGKSCSQGAARKRRSRLEERCLLKSSCKNDVWPSVYASGALVKCRKLVPNCGINLKMKKLNLKKFILEDKEST